MKNALLILLCSALGCAAVPLGFNKPRVGGTNLIFWMTFNENTGTNAANSAGLANNGQLRNSAFWKNGIASSAVGFTTNAGGNGTYVYVADSTNLVNMTTNAFTICCWVCMTNPPPSGKQSVWLHKSTSSFSGGGFGFKYVQTGAPSYAINLSKDGVSDQNVNCTIATNAWIFVAAVEKYSGSAFTSVTYYTNGVAVGSYSQSSNFQSSSGNPLNIGGGDNTYSAGQGSGGFVDDVELFNRALTDAEILQLYNDHGAR
jgi:MSHA biogenesis protein MshQ